MAKANKATKQVPVKQYSTFEHINVELSRKNSKILFIITIYRLQSESISIFFDEFAELLDLYAVSNEDFVIAGDVNIHVETDSLYSTKFREVLNLYNLKQHVQAPAHREGHTLDIIITPNDDSYLSNVNITSTDLSDHFLIDFRVNRQPKIREMKTIRYRSLKNINMADFGEEVKGRL